MDTERKFLHDIASPVGAALLTLESVVDEMSGRSDKNAGDLLILQQLLETTKKIQQLVIERRELLIAGESKT